jgi:hypothetical protein
MPCKACGSVNSGKFTGEIAIHFPEFKNIDKPVVSSWVFPEVVVCFGLWHCRAFVGSIQALATEASSLSITSANLQPSEFVIFVVDGNLGFVSCLPVPSRNTWQIVSCLPVIRPSRI